MKSKFLITTTLCLISTLLQAQEASPQSSPLLARTQTLPKNAQTIVIKSLPNTSQASFRIVAETKSTPTKAIDLVQFDTASGTYYSKAEFNHTSEESLKAELKKHLEAFSKLEDTDNLVVVIVGGFKESSLKEFVNSTLQSYSHNKPYKNVSNNPYDICYVSLNVAGDKASSLKDLWINRLIEEHLTSQIKENSLNSFSILNAEQSSNSLKIKPHETLSSKVKEELDCITRYSSNKGISSTELESFKELYLNEVEVARKSFSSHPSSTLANYLTQQARSKKAAAPLDEYLEQSPDVIKSLSLEEVNEAFKSCKLFYTFRSATDSKASAPSKSPSAENSLSLTTNEESIENSTIEAPFEEESSYSESNVANSNLSEPSLMLYFAEPQTPQDSYYNLPINDYEAKTIRNIIHIMADNNPVKLLFKEGELNRMGDQINHVHPLKFLSAIFDNPNGRKDMKKVMDNSFKFNGFMEGGKRGGLSRRMNDEFQKNNLFQHVPGFAKHLNVDPNAVTAYIQKKDWKGLVVFLSKHAH